jgi:GTP-binding protein
MSLPTVAIVGRPNVGKSSLFNRILRKQIAVVDEEAGVTRDRNYAVAEWNGVSFYLVDTGGMVPDTGDLMEKMIYDQAEFAINEADLVLFVVDTQVGADSTDHEIARCLHRSRKKCLLVANKADNEQSEHETFEFLKLGIGDPAPVSATVGRGIGELLDMLVSRLPAQETKGEAGESPIRVAVVGRPNVGKSSFINELIGKDRLIVTPIAGTTRDAVDTPFEIDGRAYVLVDTAGLRRHYKVQENIEFYTNLRTERAIAGCDVAVVLMDAKEGLTSLDQRIMEQVISNRRSVVLAVNKWDLVEKETSTADEYTRAIDGILARYAYVPVIYISARTGQRVAKVMAMVREVYDESRRQVTTSDLNDFLKRVVNRKHPPARQGKYIKLNYMTQTGVGPPSFVIFANHPKLIDKAYIAYIENRLRDEFGFRGVPFRLRFKRK